MFCMYIYQYFVRLTDLPPYAIVDVICIGFGVFWKGLSGYKWSVFIVKFIWSEILIHKFNFIIAPFRIYRFEHCVLWGAYDWTYSFSCVPINTNGIDDKFIQPDLKKPFRENTCIFIWWSFLVYWKEGILKCDIPINKNDNEGKQKLLGSKWIQKVNEILLLKLIFDFLDFHNFTLILYINLQCLQRPWLYDGSWLKAQRGILWE